MWVSFQYEQLPQLCYYCGRLGYSEKIVRENCLIPEMVVLLKDNLGSGCVRLISNNSNEGIWESMGVL